MCFLPVILMNFFLWFNIFSSVFREDVGEPKFFHVLFFPRSSVERFFFFKPTFFFARFQAGGE